MFDFDRADIKVFEIYFFNALNCSPDMKNTMHKLLFFGLTLGILFSTELFLLPRACSSAEPRGEEPLTGLSQEYPLTLEEVSRLALQNNFDIQLAKFDTLISRTGQQKTESIYDTILAATIDYRNNKNKQTSTLLGTKTLENNYDVGLSKKLPSGSTISLDSTHNRNWSNSTISSINPSHDTALELSVEQELGKNFFGLQDRGDVRISQMDIQNAEYTSLDKIAADLARVQEAYWDLVLSYEVLRIEQNMLEQAKRLWEVNIENEKHGLAEKPDVLAAEANYKVQENEFLLVKNQLQTKENVLKLMLNIDKEDVSLRPRETLALFAAPLPERNEALREAFDNRYDYKQLMNSVKSYDVRLSMKENALWPQINLKASLSRNGVDDHFHQAFQQIMDEDNSNFYIGLNFRIPFENREAHSELEATQLEKARLLVALKLLEREIAIGISDQVRICRVLKEIAENAEAIALIQENKLKEEEKRYSSGRSDTDTIIRFQSDLLQARLIASEAKFNYQTALILLEKQKGTLLKAYWDGEI